MSNLHCYYRITDKGHPLGRTELKGTFLEKLTRRKCFKNYLNAFGLKNLTVFADNVTNNTCMFLKDNGVKDIRITELGNLNGFKYLIRTALEELPENDILYIVEDDYLHTKDARQYIFEGIKLADYVSLYDSLDKYQGTNNPLIHDGGEDTMVILGDTSHFKYTNATTGTFAVKIKTLRADVEVVDMACQPHFPHPMDFLMFRHLIEVKKRKLVCPIPGKASHVGLELSPFVDWETIVKELEGEEIG